MTDNCEEVMSKRKKTEQLFTKKDSSKKVEYETANKSSPRFKFKNEHEEAVPAEYDLMKNE